MTVKSVVWKALSALALIALMAGCAAPTAAPAPTALPTIATIDPKPTFDAISTQAAATVIAELTLNAPSATPVPPTSTPEPTSTTGPTNTPAPSSTPTHAFIPWTLTPTATVAAYACSVTRNLPKSDQEIKVGESFDAKWTIKNTGTETWIAGNTDVHFADGTRMHEGGDLLDLAFDLDPNETTTVTLDMKAPATKGTYSTSWAITLGNGSECKLDLKIDVKE